MNIHDLTTQVMDLLARINADSESPEEQRLLETAMDAMLFISATGQLYDFEDYRNQRDSDAPPPVVAAFKTREEADAWLTSHPRPPGGTHVLIGNQYHYVIYFRESAHRRLVPAETLDFYVEGLTSNGPPEVLASFDTREEAEGWFARQHEVPSHAFVRIASEPYLWVYHRNVEHRALYRLEPHPPYRPVREDSSTGST